MTLLQGKRGIVIGGTSGLGLAACRKMVEWGATVLPVSSNPQKVQSALAMLGQNIALPVIAVDAADKAAVQQAVEQAVRVLGKLDYLCYFAGKLERALPERLDDDMFDRSITINAKGALYAAQAAFPYMKEQQSGAIIIITSLSSHLALGGVTAYGVGKHAALGIAMNLANEWGQYGIRVIPVSPGVIETDLNREVLKQNVERTGSFIARSPLGRLGKPEEVGSVVAFLCSDEAAFMTGSPVMVDGGLLIRGANPLKLD